VINLLRNRDERGEVSDAEIRAFLNGARVDPIATMSQVRDLRVMQAMDVVRWAIDHAPKEVPARVVTARRIVHEWFG
jgi:hypothetical protein